MSGLWGKWDHFTPFTVALLIHSIFLREIPLEPAVHQQTSGVGEKNGSDTMAQWPHLRNI